MVTGPDIRGAPLTVGSTALAGVVLCGAAGIVPAKKINTAPICSVGGLSCFLIGRPFDLWLTTIGDRLGAFRLRFSVLHRDGKGEIDKILNLRGAY